MKAHLAMMGDSPGSPYEEARERMRSEIADRLAPSRIVIDEVLTIAAPVQVVGRLPAGECFYFRSRYDSASIDVWDPGVELPLGPPPDPGDLLWTFQIERWEGFEASHLESGEAAELIQEFLGRHDARGTES